MAPIHPIGIPYHVRCGDHLLGARPIAEAMVATKEGYDTQSLCEVARNLEGLSMGVSPLPMRVILVHRHRNIVVVLENFFVTLKRLSRAVICYHEY